MSVVSVSKDGGYVDLPAPSYQGYSSVSEEIVKADRNTMGNGVKQRINIKAHIELQWKGISADKKNLIISSTDPNSFNIRYLSMMDDSVKYGNFYRGNDLQIQGYGRFNGRNFEYYDVKFTLVEL